MFLNCHTAFSFKYGTLSIERLFHEARRCGVHKLVLTEINNTSSYIEMLRICEENAPVLCNLDDPKKQALTKYEKESYQLDIAVGVEFRRENELLYIAIARNNTGFENINRFLSHVNLKGEKPPFPAPAFDENVFIIYPFEKIDPERLRHNEYIGVRIQQLNIFSVSKSRHGFENKFVILHPVTIANKIDHNVHRLLRAIDLNTLLSKLPEHQEAAKNEIMMPERELLSYFEQFPQLIENTKYILDNSSIDISLGTDKNKKHVTRSEKDDWVLLVAEAEKGLQKRYGLDDKSIRERFDKELRIIREKNFCAYFLIAFDLIRFAKSKGFDFVGRGSGANSVVAYCLGITNVDPIELDLYFERFLNPERTSPPDFDLDFSWDNRDEIYEYLFNKYGKDHVCLLGTHVTYQKRSVLRELGKVFGLPKDEIDAIVEEPDKNKNRDHIVELIFKYAEHIKDLPSNISIHAGGVLITDKPIYAYTALELPPKGYPVSQFEMHSAEDMGIFKFDILSQRGLGHLKETIKHVKRNKGIDIDIHRFTDFKKDETIKELLRNSKTMGCFYVESPAMRMLLGKLKCEDYLTLVAASSIIRPGVASSGMMRAYIERYHAVRNNGSYESIHPRMDELMKETFGVMVYQEDVIKVAHYFAGLSLTDADVLRRGMSGKYRSRQEFKRVEHRFFENCQQLGYDSAVIDRVWYEIESFGGYSFAKGHSASYAVESYQSLHLKAHYPLEFMVGVINNFGGFYKTEFYFHEARMNGAKIEAPCVNQSEYLTTIYDRQIYIGFIHLKSLETKVAKKISIEREQNGPFKSLDNFLRRVELGLEQIRILIRIGSLRFTGKSKQRLLWEALLYFSNAKTRSRTTTDLFDTEPNEYPLPTLQRNAVEDAFDEIELLGFPLGDPFDLVDTKNYGDTSARELLQKIGRPISILGYIVITKDTQTKNGQPMHFGTFYDCHGEIFDTIHFPDVARKFPLRGRGFYFIKGKVVEDFGVSMVEVEWMDKIPFVNKKDLPMEEMVAEKVNSRPHRIQ
ncbi:MAG TPA: DNA polymerase III subunit alpha [Cyclobacteriaceae bacterium]|nr:DNA polymerase III subunit alpha [Cyclobacteriaceae bacterium]